MSAPSLALLNTGLVTAVGLSAAASCAAFRAKATNSRETAFLDDGGEWIMGCPVDLDEPLRGIDKLARMSAIAIRECLQAVAPHEWPALPLLLCVAERSRPGRMAGLEERLFSQIEADLGCRFAPQSGLVPAGRVGVGIALRQARKLVHEGGAPFVLIAAVDSLLTGPQLSAYEKNERLLTSAQSNGFIPGEAAGALLVGQPTGGIGLTCTGIGFGTEKATIESEEPLRADGLVCAVRDALAEAGCGLHDLNFRITDVSGEQYFFKEAALAVGRVLRKRKKGFDLWHAAECTGETGAAAGVIALAVADAACKKEYAPGPGILVHASNDSGERAAIILQYASC